MKRAVLAVAFLWGIFGFHTAMSQNEVPCSPAWGANPPKAQEAATLYMEFYKQGNYKEALPHIKTLWQLAPGARQNAYIHGISIYKNLFAKTTDEQLRKGYIDTIMLLYDSRIRCFGTGYGYKAMDMYQLAPADVEKTLAAFDSAFYNEGNDISHFALFPYMITSEKAMLKGQLDTATFINRYMDMVLVANKNAAHFNAVLYQEQVRLISERMAQVLPCGAIHSALQKQYDANPNDMANAEKIFGYLSALRCGHGSLFVAITEKLAAQKPSEELYRTIYLNLMNEGKYNEALPFINKAMELSTEKYRKAEYHLSIAKIHQRNGEFIAARASALAAAQLKSSGEPYLLIGDLYRASGKLCGNGTGWDSQVVIWAALDMYEHAKSIDPSVAADANKKINESKELLPSASECFFRSLKEGDTWTIGCWINEATTVRCLRE